MLLNRFFVNVLIRVVFIALSSLVLAIVLQHIESGYYFTLAGMLFLTVFQAYLLVKLVNKTNTELETFFSSIGDLDSSIHFSEREKDNTFRKLHERMNSINAIIQNTKMENEKTSHFLKSVVDHVDVGLLSFDKNGNIGIFNRTAGKYLSIRHPQQLLTIKSENEEIFQIMNSIKPGQEVLYKKKIDNVLQSILMKASELNFESSKIKLISLQDITNELDRKELDSWKRLIRVLTHEIMNSISPITSLAKVISGYFKKENGNDQFQLKNIDQQTISKTISGLNTIEETGGGLLEFVDRFRSLTLLPKPNCTKFTIGSLFSKCKILMESNVPDNIKISTKVQPENLTLEADYIQVEQMLINLIKNAIEAIRHAKKGAIILKAFRSDKSIVIQVEDNGIGISPDIIEDIFVPFYTTKESGSGIGLSLSKQIMQNHEGTISVISSPGKGSKFSLKFNV